MTPLVIGHRGPGSTQEGPGSRYLRQTARMLAGKFSRSSDPVARAKLRAAAYAALVMAAAADDEVQPWKALFIPLDAAWLPEQRIAQRDAAIATLTDLLRRVMACTRPQHELTLLPRDLLNEIRTAIAWQEDKP